MTWDDAEDIGIELYEKYPETDPLTVRFTDLHNHVLELEGIRATRPNQTKASWRPSKWRGMRNGRKSVAH